MTLAPDQVTAVLVTRGDVDLTPIINTLPKAYEVVVWNNAVEPGEWGLFGRYLGIHRATRPVIYVQDDDCLIRNHDRLLAEYEPGVVTANFRDDPPRVRAFSDSTLIGWGAIFDRELPFTAFHRYQGCRPFTRETMTGLGAEFAFPMLTPTKKILVNVGWSPEDPVQWLTEEDVEVYARSNRMSQAPDFDRARDTAMRDARAVRAELGLKKNARAVR